MPNFPASNLCANNLPTTRHDVVYFVSEYPRRFEPVPAQYIEPWWASRLSLWPNRISKRKPIQEVTLLTVMRDALQPNALYVVRVGLLPEHHISPESVRSACADMVRESRRPNHEFSDLWVHHILRLPERWESTLAIFLDEPIQNLNALPLRVGGPLCMATSARIPVTEAIDLMTRSEVDLPF